MFARFSSLAAVLLLTVVVGCQTAPKTEAKKESLKAQADATFKMYKATDGQMQSFLDNAHAVAVFPEAGKAGLIVGGAYGKGIVYRNGEMIGYADMTQASVGLQAGGQAFSEVIAFENEAALNRFKNNELALTANVSAVIIKSGAGASAKYNDGVAVFIKPEAGAMAEASVGGQKFTFRPASSPME